MTDIKNKVKYDYNFLQEFCKENNITLLQDYSNEKINSYIKIEGKCIYKGCNESFIKSFHNLIVSKNFSCINHTKNIRYERSKQKNLEN